jgi:hypothetical protein
MAWIKCVAIALRAGDLPLERSVLAGCTEARRETGWYRAWFRAWCTGRPDLEAHG